MPGTERPTGRELLRCGMLSGSVLSERRLLSARRRHLLSGVVDRLLHEPGAVLPVCVLSVGRLLLLGVADWLLRRREVLL